MTIYWASFIFGIVGGLLAELLKWYQLRESPNLPEYTRKPLYWVLTGLMILAGGVLVVIHGVEPRNPWLAINIGISAPLILKGFAASVPVKPGALPETAGVPGGGGLPPFGMPGSQTRPEPNPINFLAGR